MRWFQLILAAGVGFAAIALLTTLWHSQLPHSAVATVAPGISLQVGHQPCDGKAPQISLPKSALTPAEVAVVVNLRDPQSVAVADYYQRRRGIPEANMIRVSFAAQGDAIAVPEFERLKAQVEAQLSPQIQAIALSFTRPFRVDCLGITSAFTLDHDGFCQQPQNQPAVSCRPPVMTPYFNAESVAPFSDFGLRPAMMLAGTSTAEVQHLIDRGIAADASFPKGTAYLVTTSDRARSVRAGIFSLLAQGWPAASGWQIQSLKPETEPDWIEQRPDVLFYFTGLKRVPELQTNHYLPGAIADHLTSFGGVLRGGPQMSILEWLQAGVTASYGTVVEPCNLTAKFSDPEILLRHYYRGATAIEAYWKAVASPYEGVFVGEPLARPMGVRQQMQSDYLQLQLSILKPRQIYQLQGATQPNGPYQPVAEPIRLNHEQVVEIRLGCDRPYYRLVALD